MIARSQRERKNEEGTEGYGAVKSGRETAGRSVGERVAILNAHDAAPAETDSNSTIFQWRRFAPMRRPATDLAAEDLGGAG